MIIPDYSCFFLIFLDYFFQSVKMMKVKNQSSAAWKLFGGIVVFCSYLVVLMRCFL